MVSNSRRLKEVYLKNLGKWNEVETTIVKSGSIKGTDDVVGQKGHG